MSAASDTLKLRILLYFLQNREDVCNVTNIARTLGEEKYTITRNLTALEKEGLIDRSNARKPVLTEFGRLEAKRYAERIDITMNHLMYEGVDPVSAQHDALHWALYNSESTMESIRATEERYRVKYELREEKNFSGVELCKRMHDGIYQFPFLIYREHVKDGTNISMANAGFENLCTLHVQNGIGTIQLRTKAIQARSGMNGLMMNGRVEQLQYFEAGSFIQAEVRGNVITFPASVLQFINIGGKAGQILHGSVGLRINCTAGVLHMPVSTAIFTMLI